MRTIKVTSKSTRHEVMLYTISKQLVLYVIYWESSLTSKQVQ